MAITEQKKLRKDFLKSIGGGFIPNENLRLPDGEVKKYANYHVDGNNKIATVNVYSQDEIIGAVRQMPEDVYIRGVRFKLSYREAEKTSYDVNPSEPKNNNHGSKTRENIPKISVNEESELETTVKRDKPKYHRSGSNRFRPIFGY